MSGQSEWIQLCQSALEIPLDYGRFLPRLGRAASVLLLVRAPQPQVDQYSDLEILFVRRTTGRGPHSGQIAFPGGKVESDQGESALDAALRETFEEVGISREHLRVLGELPSLATPSGFLISPGVAMAECQELSFALQPTEIEEARWVSIRRLMEPGVYRREPVSSSLLGALIDTDAFWVDSDFRIWGATGAMTKNFLDRLQSRVDSSP
jgi:8-oxo-dGTP pyrophosphatase MutT (NUDIX family)